MSNRVIWIAGVLVLVAGIVLGLALSALGPDLGLSALYEDVDGWALVGRAAVVLLVLAIPVGYIVLLIAGAVRFARAGEGEEPLVPLEYIQRGERSTIQRVLVSTRGGPHASLGLHLATGIARAGEGEVTVFRVLPETEDVDTESEVAALEKMAQPVKGKEVPVRVRVATNPSVVDAILEELREGEYDLLIVGASDEGAVRRLLFGTVPDAVVEQTPCPVLIVRRPLG